MKLENLIEACGGSSNILRALRVKQSVIFELRDPDLRKPSDLLSFNEVLNQVTWVPDTPLLEDQWEYLTSVVEKNQRQKLSDFQQVLPSSHRPLWHIAPAQGLMNDPNGFIFHKGQYHLFYQLNPYSCDHKDKYWAYSTSDNLLDWQQKPVALCPSAWFDSHGVFSGHALSNGDEMMLFYTGNVRIGEQRDRVTSQCLATTKDGVNFQKHGPVIPELPPEVTPHFRDPKIIRNKDHWVMVLGAQHESETGRLALYRSDDLYNWHFVGLMGQELGQFGYMWECPDLFELEGQPFNIICPQGIESSSEFHQIPHHNGYCKAVLTDDDQLTLHDFTTMDHGFDFYAPQTTEAEDGRRILIGWMGLPDEIDQPSTNDGWLHQMTCPRELTQVDGRIYQRPVRELQQLRGEKRQFNFDTASHLEQLNLETKSFELQTVLKWPETGTRTLRMFDDGDQFCDLILDQENQRMILDRRSTLPTDGETRREIKFKECSDIELQILADQSSVEIFINNGQYTMTARVFTNPEATGLSLISDTDTNWQPVVYWPLACEQK